MKIIRISALWCTSCIITYNTWNEIKTKYSNIEYEEYDYDFDKEIVDKYEVDKIIPVTIFIKDDQEIKRITGEFKKKEIIKCIEELGE